MKKRLMLPVAPIVWLVLMLSWLDVSSAFSDSPVRLEPIFAPDKDVRFVAVNGSDNNPGTVDRPWATVNHAAEQAYAGDTIVVRGGHYVLPGQVRPRNSGRPGAWITFIGYPGEEPILDARTVSRASFAHGILNDGVFQIEDIAYVRVVNLTVTNSPDAGFTIRDSQHIDLINNSTKGTSSSGIAVWDTNHDGRGTEHIRILGNTIMRATIWDPAPPGGQRRGEPPHEALSIGGAVDFEVAYNHVYDSDKEGIDIKETSRRGKVHHNLVHDVARQGIYVDAWFGGISDVEIFSNVVHNCHGAGMVLSVENGTSVERVDIHNNLVFDNDGSGLFFSRWSADHLRQDIHVSGNVFFHNGYGPPRAGQAYYWLTGGLYLLSTNLKNISIERNVFSDNKGFQIGYSELYMRGDRTWRTAKESQHIRIDANLIDGRNSPESPIISGGEPSDRVKIYADNGDHPIFGNPLFRDPAAEDFSLRRGSPANGLSSSSHAAASPSGLWWKTDFPPKLVQMQMDRAE